MQAPSVIPAATGTGTGAMWPVLLIVGLLVAGLLVAVIVRERRPAPPGVP